MNESNEKKNSKAKQNYNKSGKLAKRKETRRLEAIARQVRRVQTLEKALEKNKNKKLAGEKLAHAQLTLQQIRGGVPHAELAKRFTPEVATGAN